MALLTKEATEGLKDRGKLLGGTVALLWAIHIVNTIMGHAFDIYGVIPRTLSGLWGILCAPFLHANFAHLIANTGSLLIFGWLVMLRRTRDLVTVGALSALTAGLGTWLIGGAHTVHIGASGVIFGLFGFLLSRGIFERKVWPVVGSLLSLVFFGGMLRGVFPGLPGISWEGHLFGFLGGILAARLAAEQAMALPAARQRIALAPAPLRISADTQEPEADEDVEADLAALRRKVGR
jgi:membrane associated rhomboid family serine protease